MTSTIEPPATAESPPGVGRTELGTVTVADRVVARLAARAALEIPDAGGAAPRILGRSLDGVKGARSTSLDALPRTTAEVDGSVAVISLELSVRWPASVPATAARVRAHVADRITELTGLTVIEIRIQVTDLVTHLTPPPRVH